LKKSPTKDLLDHLKYTLVQETKIMSDILTVKCGICKEDILNGLGFVKDSSDYVFSLFSMRFVPIGAKVIFDSYLFEKEPRIECPFCDSDELYILRN